MVAQVMPPYTIPSSASLPCLSLNMSCSFPVPVIPHLSTSCPHCFPSSSVTWSNTCLHTCSQLVINPGHAKSQFPVFGAKVGCAACFFSTLNLELCFENCYQYLVHDLLPASVSLWICLPVLTEDPLMNCKFSLTYNSTALTVNLHLGLHFVCYSYDFLHNCFNIKYKNIKYALHLKKQQNIFD